jgi:uncharacterized membrane protein YukC
MKKTILILTILVLLLFVVLYKHIQVIKGERAFIKKDKFFCDSSIENCKNSNTNKIPHGVCVPGGKCS